MQANAHYIEAATYPQDNVKTGKMTFLFVSEISDSDQLQAYDNLCLPYIQGALVSAVYSWYLLETKRCSFPHTVKSLTSPVCRIGKYFFFFYCSIKFVFIYRKEVQLRPQCSCDSQCIIPPLIRCITYIPFINTNIISKTHNLFYSCL